MERKTRGEIEKNEWNMIQHLHCQVDTSNNTVELHQLSVHNFKIRKIKSLAEHCLGKYT